MVKVKKKSSHPEEKTAHPEEHKEVAKPGETLPRMESPLVPIFEKYKEQIEAFKNKCVEKFDKYITGISILPPLPSGQVSQDHDTRQFSPTQDSQLPPVSMPSQPKQEEVQLFILVDDGDVQKITRSELIIKITDIMTAFAKEMNVPIRPQVMLISELKEACYDAKYDIIQTVAYSGVVFDRGLLSALKVAELHKTKVVRKFEKYVMSYIAVGSLFRGDSAPNDIDVAIVIDDTDVKKMSRFELRDKLRAIIINMGYEAGDETGVKAEFHIQTYILTDFWESVKDANPVIFTMLRDGVPLFDHGVFMPWKLLLQMGRIRPSPEAIDMNMELGDRLIERTKQKLLSVVGEDLFYAVMNPTQAALMLYGIPPPTPKEAVKLMDDIYVKKEKLLEKKYVDILEKIRKTFKDIEHRRIVEVTGKDVDRLLQDCQEYLNRIKKLFQEIEDRNEQETMKEIYTTTQAVTRDLLLEKGVKSVTADKLVSLFRKHICEDMHVSGKYVTILEEIIKAKKDYDAKKLTKQEINKVRREAKEYVRLVFDLLEKERAVRLDRCRVRFTSHGVVGEILMLEKVVFYVPNIGQREEIMIGTIEPDGSIQNVKKSSVEEYENYIKHLTLRPEMTVKPRTIESLRTLAGEDVEVIWKA